MSLPFVDTAVQNRPFADHISKELQALLAKGDFILGGKVRAFEEAFADYLKVEEAIGVANGTDALVLALRALELPEGSEVLLPVNTFFATAEAVIHAKLKPVFVDCVPDTALMDLNQLRNRITQKTKALIAVHLFGQMVDMQEISTIAEKYELKVIEDTAQAHGARNTQGFAGTLSDVGTFSFYPSKNLGALGDGGMVVTRDARIADKVRQLRDHGSSVKYTHSLVGTNSRLDTFQAAVLLNKLPYLDEWNEKRRALASFLTRELKKISDLNFFKTFKAESHVHHLFVMLTPYRDGLLNALREDQIYCGVHYPIPCHLQPALDFLEYRKGDFPVAEKLAQEMISLPFFPELTHTQCQLIIDRITHHMSLARRSHEQTAPTQC